MRRFTAILLVLMLLMPAGIIASAQEDMFAECTNLESLFMYADEALQNGMPAKQVLAAMSAWAEDNGVPDELTCACENIAATSGKNYQKIRNYANKWAVYIWSTSPASEDTKNNWTAYTQYDVSDKMKTALKDGNAQFCFPAAAWGEANFKSQLGTEYSKFKSTQSRAGYACIVIKKGSQSAPETGWTSDKNGDFTDALTYTVSRLVSQLGEDAPILTGNPYLASTFWVFSLDYPFYSWYGENNSKEVKGYNVNISLTVTDAPSKKTIAQIKKSSKLPKTIYRWSNGIAKPDVPVLSDDQSYNSFVQKVANALRKERGSAASSRKINSFNAEQVLNGILLEQSNKQSDAWEKAIYESGAQAVTFENGKLSFLLRGYDPQLSELGAYKSAADKSIWLETALENAARFTLRLSLPVQDGQLPSSSIKTLNTKVKTAASEAKKAFASSDFSSALKDMLFPSPRADKVTKAEQLMKPDTDFYTRVTSRYGGPGDTAPAQALSALYYAQKSVTVSTKNGPHSIKLSCTGADPASMLKSASKATLDQLAGMTASRRDTEDLSGKLNRQLADIAISQREKEQNKYTISIDLDDLSDGAYPADYQKHFKAFAYDSTLEALEENAEQLPDIACRNMPKTGVIKGGNGSTKVTVKISKNSNPTYVQFQTERGGRTSVTAFIEPGKQVSFKLDKGNYRILYCSGPYWYGEKEMFSTLGVYQKSDTVVIKDKNYTHTFTLESSDDGDINIYSANPSEFH